ncbi:MAG TPA: rhodanese-like domain-containing protein [Methanothrix sp.]|nr:rhodanese-like domain-containing protein [Methanothrix sp.]
MGFGLSGGCKRDCKRAAAGMAALSLLASVFLNLIVVPALAGTETGEFCPTCPDWTNLEGWLAQKEAYEKAQQNGQQNADASGGQSSQPNSNSAASAGGSEENGYVRPEILAGAASLLGSAGSSVILDARSPKEYSSGHIPGARNLYWKDLQQNGGDGLDPAGAAAALGRAGVNASDSIVIYGGESGADDSAAFVFWALSYLGQKQVSLLDGGIEAAEKAGIALTQNAPSSTAVNHTASAKPWLLVTPENLGELLSQADVRILDARDFSDYGQGRLGNSSICLSSEKLYDSSGIRDAATLKDLFGRRVEKDGTAIVYGTPQAYSLFFSLELMGYNATLLEGDWWQDTEWAVSNVR